MDLLRTGEFYSVACALLWSAATILFRKSGEYVPPVALNLFKNTVAAVLFVASLAVRGGPFVPADRTVGDWAVLLLSGVVGVGIADSLFFASLNRLGAARNAIVSCLYLPVVVICSYFYLREPIGPSLLLAAGLMVAAIALGTAEPSSAAEAGTPRRVAAGVAIGAASMVLMGMAIVFAKPVLDVADAWWATTVRVLGGLLFLAAQAALPPYTAEAARCFRPSAAWRVTLPAAVLGSYLAMIVWILGMKYTYASTAAVLNQTSTIFTAVLGWIVLRERLTARKIAGVVLAFAGAALIVG